MTVEVTGLIPDQLCQPLKNDLVKPVRHLSVAVMKVEYDTSGSQGRSYFHD